MVECPENRTNNRSELNSGGARWEGVYNYSLNDGLRSERVGGVVLVITVEVLLLYLCYHTNYCIAAADLH